MAVWASLTQDPGVCAHERIMAPVLGAPTLVGPVFRAVFGSKARLRGFVPRNYFWVSMTLP